MSLKVKIQLETAPADYDYAAEVFIAGNSIGILLGHIAHENPTSENIIAAIKENVEWELNTQHTKYTSINWIINEKVGA